MFETDKVLLGNNLDLLKRLPDNCIDSVVTDPPYGISFMNKSWDYDVPTVELWREVLRVLKPGGHALVACGTRTQHRMAVNLEDAGFEIRDIVAWVYGSGFPKSMDISQAIDKMKGAEREVIKTSEMGNHNGGKHCGIEESYGFKESFDITIPSTPEAQEWQGWGSNLKPAMELFSLVRKPIKGTVAENVLRYGVGGLNIDGCRVGTEERTQWSGKGTNATVYKEYKQDNAHFETVNGRFPANFIHDGSDEVVALFPQTTSGELRVGDKQGSGMFGKVGGDFINGNYGGDSGSASRFFYTAKASQSERNDGLWGFEERAITDGRETPIDNAFNRGMTEKRNIHPTVKPLDLMRYLCRMITPKGGVVLDPFLGSGTTAIAAKQEKMQYIGMEIEPKYVAIAEARIKAAIVEYDIFDFLGGTTE